MVDARELIEKWVLERKKAILDEAFEDIDNAARNAIDKLKSEIEGLQRQAKTMEVLLPIDLIETIAKGGFIMAEDVDIQWSRSEISVYIANTHPEGLKHRLDEGRYRVTLIVERLEKEE